MTLKVTWLFSYSTTPDAGGLVRSGGWSESWYTEFSGGETALQNRISRWAQKRAFLLPASTRIIAARVGQVAVGSRSVIKQLQIPGTQLNTTDVPQMSLQFPIATASGTNQRVVLLRGLPDTWVVGGSLNFASGVSQFTAAFVQNLREDLWLIRGRNLAAAQIPIVSISSGGAFVLAADSTFVSSNRIQVIRSLETATQRQRGGIFTIASMTDVRNGTLTGWKFGTCTGGAVRPSSYTYQLISIPAAYGVDNLFVTQRKAGRAFFQYRGRRSKR